jgi:hypothetical protein
VGIPAPVEPNSGLVGVATSTTTTLSDRFVPVLFVKLQLVPARVAVVNCPLSSPVRLVSGSTGPRLPGKSWIPNGAVVAGVVGVSPWKVRFLSNWSQIRTCLALLLPALR